MNNKVEILRDQDQKIETKGVLSVLNDSDATVFSCLTLELPDKNNAPKISCIPPGVYLCKKVGVTHIPYPHIAVTGVANREGISIHYGNFAAGKKVDILGCILTGSKYSDINNDGTEDIINSKTTFEKLMAILPNEFTLTIK